MKQQILDELTRFLGEMEEELSCCNQEELTKRQLTSKIIRGTLLLVLCLFAANSYYLYQLSSGLSDSLAMIDVMAERFGHATGSLRRITGEVDSISTKFHVLDGINTDMANVSHEVAAIGGSLGGISATVGSLGNEMQQVNFSMSLMDAQVYGMNGNVQQIGSDMHKMSGPMNFMNKMMPW